MYRKGGRVPSSIFQPQGKSILLKFNDICVVVSPTSVSSLPTARHRAINMGQNISRAAFDGLLAKTHVEHALIQPNDGHNDIPTVSAQPATHTLSTPSACFKVHGLTFV